MSTSEHVYVLSMITDAVQMEFSDGDVTTAIGSLTAVFREYPTCAEAREWFRTLYDRGCIGPDALECMLSVSIPSSEVVDAATENGNDGLTAEIDDGVFLNLCRAELRG